MATTLEVPTISSPQPKPNPRKRKKRAPAAGAAVDCFACADRKIRCDRRRPYCSQCLDAGQDCSGYKTQLTWGIGVASRGKLRGLSLPIAGTQKLASAGGPPKTKRQREHADVMNQTGHNDVKLPQEETTKFHLGEDVLREEHCLASKLPHSTESTEQTSRREIKLEPHPELFTNNPRTTAQPFPLNDTSISQSLLDPNVHSTSAVHSDPWTTQLQTTNYTSSDYPTSALAVGTPPLSSIGYLYPHGSYDRSLNVLLQDPFQELKHPTSNPSDISGLDVSILPQTNQPIPTQIDDLAEEADEEVMRQYSHECAVIDDPNLYGFSSTFEFSFPLPALSGMSNIGKTLRMQYLINYYSEVISPVIVAFDSPNNPFRNQILRLAMSSETLQHAISALSASNLRQRRGIGLLSTGKTAPARRSSMAHVNLIDEKWHAQGLLSPEEQMREETFHKRLAVSQLNQQLAHPVLRKDDSILATLLILCLFHICDSGVAKFQTQFAGVRKLLALRGDATIMENENFKWMSRLFTLFDSLAATVNDREGQLGGRLTDISELCGDWSLENMAGVDGQLFKIISKLGRLNTLRQGKQVERDTSPVYEPLQPPPQSAYSYTTLDGNGWVQNEVVGERASSDDNPQFWKEWQAIRSQLLSWSLNTSLFDSVSKEASYLTVDQRIDMENISESFRYAALIYIERLAQPELPSDDGTIQRWVRQSLHYIRLVQSDVYLLWPLFITGTECIDDAGRSVIRGRCADIQKDSGFVNNASCLELLEKIWRANARGLSPRPDGDSPPTQDDHGSRYGSSFMFRQVMMRESANGADGEYIVV